MERFLDRTARHTPPGSASQRADGPKYVVGNHTSRREIDMALGAYIALCTCSEDQAREALISVAREARVGLGAVSQALLALTSGAVVTAEGDPALAQWTVHLAAAHRAGTD